MAESTRLLVLQVKDTAAEDEILRYIEEMMEDGVVKVLAGTIVRPSDTNRSEPVRDPRDMEVRTLNATGVRALFQGDGHGCWIAPLGTTTQPPDEPWQLIGRDVNLYG
jgi:hypothetical protein